MSTRSPGARRLRAILFPSLFVAVAGCSFFGGKPALPKPAATEASLESSPPDRLAAAINDAEVIYCSVGKSDAARRSIWKLISALQTGGVAFTIGWEMLDLDQQPILDAAAEDPATEIAARVAWQVPARERESYREILLQTARPEIAHAALGCPKSLLVKVRQGEPLAAAESDLIPHGFTAPPADYESFVEHLATTPGDRRDEPAALYRAHLVAEQVVAAKIVALGRAEPTRKLLIFLRSENLTNPFGVPFYVRQKLHSRQLILEEGSGAGSPRSNLLTLGKH